MAKVTIEEQYLNDIGLALQEQLDTTDKFYPQDMGDSIRAIPSGGSTDGLLNPVEICIFKVGVVA